MLSKTFETIMGFEEITDSQTIQEMKLIQCIKFKMEYARRKRTAVMDGRNFGPHLLWHLKQRKMTQKALSELTGIGRAGISSICSGKREPNIYTVVKILRALNISLEEILVPKNKWR